MRVLWLACCLLVVCVARSDSFLSPTIMSGGEPPPVFGPLVIDMALAGDYTDASGNGNDGTPSGTPAFGAAQWGTALQCDGVDDMVTIASDPSFANLTEYTITACVNLNTYGENGIGRIFDWDNASSGSEVRYYPNQLNASQQLNEGRYATEGRWRGPDNSVLLGTNYHLGMTFNQASDEVIFYINGVQQTVIVEQAPIGPFTPNTGNLHVCNRNDQARTFDGFLGNFKLYNEVLNASQIAAIYQADCFQPPPAQLAIHLPLAGDYTDISGNNNTGTPFGTPGFTSASWGTALQCDGVDDRVTIAADPTFTSATSYTVSACLNLSSYGENDSGRVMVWEEQGSTATAVNMLTDGGGGANQLRASELRWATQNADFSTPLGSLLTGRDYHVAYTYDQATDTGELYINGLALGTQDAPGTGAFPRGTGPMHVCNRAADDRTLHGTIGQYRFYTEVRSQGQIDTDYQADCPPVAQPALAVYLPLEGDYVDISGNGNNGTPSGAPVFGAASWGTALDCDGVNDRVEIAPDPTFNDTTSYTVAACVNLDGYGGSDTGRIVSWEKGGPVGDALNFFSEGSKASPELRAIEERWAIFDSDFSSPPDSLLTGTDYHVAFTYDQATDTGELYINGVAVGTQTVVGQGSFVPATGPLHVCNRDSDDRPLDGRIGHVRFYTEVRSQPQIDAIYQSDCPAVAPGPPPVVYLPLEGDYADASGNGNDGTPGGSPAFGAANWGTALACDGVDDIVTITDDPSFADLTQYTATACINATTYGGGGLGRIMDWNNSGGFSTVRYFVTDSSDAMQLNEGRYPTTEGQWISPGNSIQAGTNYHVAVTHDSTTQATQFYIDGVAVTTNEIQTPTGTFAPATGNLHLCNRGTLGREFDGFLGHFRLYDQVLDAGQINGVFQSDCPSGVPSALAIYLPLSGDYADTSGNGNNGTPFGTPAFTSASWGTALDCDGVDDRVTISADPTFDNATSYTVSACVNMNSYGESNLGRIMSWEQSGGGGEASRVFAGSVAGENQLRGDDARWDTTDSTFESPAGSFAINTNYHVAYTYDQPTDTGELYINGVAVGTQTNAGTGGFIPTTDAMHVCNAAAFDRTFDGSVGHFRFYTEVRSQAQIDADYQSDCPASTGVTQWFALPSSLTTEIPPAQPISSESAAILSYIQAQSFFIGWNDNTFAAPQYDADALPVNIVNWTCTDCNPQIPVAYYSNVPTPIGVEPASGNDGHMIIYNSQYVWEFFAVNKISDTQWETFTMTRKERSGSGVYPGPDLLGSVTGCYGSSMLEGTVTREEYLAAEAGDRNAIKHAVHLVVFDLKQQGGGFPRIDPCYGFVNGNDPTSPLVYGQRIRLKSTVDVESLPLTNFEKAILIAAQKYGWLYSDSNCGSCTSDIRLESDEHTTWKWPNPSAGWPGVVWTTDFEVVTPITVP